MAEHARGTDSSDPHDPARSAVNPRGRRKALLFFGLIVVAVAVLGLMAFYWTTRPVQVLTEQDVERSIGTAGQPTPGGHNPNLTPKDTVDEINSRGTESFFDLAQVLSANPSNALDRRVVVRHVTVTEISGTTAWVQDDQAKVAVRLPDTVSELRAGQTVDLEGTIEGDGRGGVRIAATRVTLR
jgi:hypothetical protein